MSHWDTEGQVDDLVSKFAANVCSLSKAERGCGFTSSSSIRSAVLVPLVYQVTPFASFSIFSFVAHMFMNSVASTSHH